MYGAVRVCVVRGTGAGWLGLTCGWVGARAHVQVFFDKITRRIVTLCEMAPRLDPAHVDPAEVAQKVVSGVYPGVRTAELDSLAAETAAYMSARHPDYSVLAARIAVSNLHKQTSASFAETMALERNYVNPKTGEPAPLLAEDVYAIVAEHAAALDAAIRHERDFAYDYFGFKTLERSYLARLDGRIAERPQHMLMRVAVGIHKHDLDAALETYRLTSEGWFTHASPTLFNAGTPVPQMSSCFLLQMREDSIDGIYDTLKQCAMVSKCAGGVGLAVHKIRAKESYIRGTNGSSNGLVPMLRVFNDTARYVDQGMRHPHTPPRARHLPTRRPPRTTPSHTTHPMRNSSTRHTPHDTPRTRLPTRHTPHETLPYDTSRTTHMH